MPIRPFLRMFQIVNRCCCVTGGRRCSFRHCIINSCAVVFRPLLFHCEEFNVVLAPWPLILLLMVFERGFLLSLENVREIQMLCILIICRVSSKCDFLEEIFRFCDVQVVIIKTSGCNFIRIVELCLVNWMLAFLPLL